MGDELPAAGRRQGGGNRDFDAELVRSVRLALANAFHLRCVQRIDLRSALVLLLLKHSSRPGQHAPQHDSAEQVGVAAEFAADVADDAAEIGFEPP